MFRSGEASAVASTSRLPVHASSAGAGKRAQGDFNQQEDFISFSEILDDEDSRPYRGKGKGREAPNGFRGKKRSIGEVLDEKGKARLQDVQKTTPWAANVDWDAHASATEQLSAEIKAFTKYITPTDQEHELRTCVVESIRRLIRRQWRDATVHAFGSFETRLYLPTGDIDLVIISPSISKEQRVRTLHQLSGLLRSSNLGTNIIVIGKARVPIIKFVTRKGGFKVDISVNMNNGIQVSKRVLQLFAEVGEEPARSLIMVTKAFLNQRNMNEVYSGGLGSYSIICLAVSFLQLHPKLQSGEIKAMDNLGTLLIEFLELYGKHFNFEEVGVCLSGGGSYYSKSKRGWLRYNQPYLLSIEDPADPTNDVAGGSHNIKAVQQSIGGAFEVLTYAIYVRTSIILARISAAQSGRMLPTLSGRAIPHADPGGEEGEEIDECRKSLLGTILGVTSEIEASRIEAARLASSGEVQLSVGRTPSLFDSEGMLYDPAAPPNPPRADSAPKKTIPDTTAALAMRANGSSAPVPEEVPTKRPRKPTSLKTVVLASRALTPPAFTGTRSQSKAGPPVIAQIRTGVTGRRIVDQPTRQQNGVIDISDGEDGAAVPSAPTSVSETRSYINLDSPSPSPPPEGRKSPDTLRANAAGSDSRYSVQKGGSTASVPKLQYDPVDAYAESSSGEDSDIVLVSTSKGKGQANRAGAGSNKGSPGRPTRARGTSRPAGSKANGKAATSSDMDVSSATSVDTDEKETKESTAKARTTVYQSSRGTSESSKPSRKPLLSNKTRQDYWQAKGQGSGHAVDSDSDSDTVYVRSK